MILGACKSFDIDPAHAILFGDTVRDIEAAAAAKLRAGIFFSGGNLFNAVKAELDKL